MLKNLIATLRPATESVADVQAALDRTRTAGDEANAVVMDAIATRDGLLLDGTIEQLDAADNALAAARTAQERVGGMEAQLIAKLAAVQLVEDTASAKAAAEAVDAAHAAIEAFTESKVPELTKLGKEGVALLDALKQAREARLLLESWFIVRYGGSKYPTFKAAEFNVLDSRMSALFSTLRHVAALDTRGS